VLAEALQAHVVVVGQNFTFGAGGGGGPAQLAAAGAEAGFAVEVVALAVARDKAISSTRIRRLLSQGHLEEVRDILGRPPSTHGKVVGGWQRGRTLGVPTANLDVEAGTIFPGRGVYAGRALVEDHWYRAAINVGHNPTFHSKIDETAVVRIEAHLLDFSGNLYDKPIRVDFLHKIRNEERFAQVDALVARMREDIATTRSLADPAYDEVALS
jgi:riboflavin kinase/FMN adenylyltransferase